MDWVSRRTIALPVDGRRGVRNLTHFGTECELPYNAPPAPGAARVHHPREERGLPPDIDILVAAWCTFALLCGGLIKGALGVGTPLLTVPLMALVLPPQIAVALMAVPVVVANVWQASSAREPLRVVGRFWPAFACLLVGTVIGVKILAIIDDRLLLLLVGIAVIAFTLVQGSSYKLEIAPSFEKPAGAAFGLASGLIGGISSMFGPMLIIYLVSLRNFTKSEFVASISFLYVGAVVPWLLTLIFFGILVDGLLLASIVASVPIGIGMLLGQRVRRRISEHYFHRLVLAVLLVSGGTMIWRALN